MSLLKISEAAVLAFHAMISIATNRDRTFPIKEIAKNHHASEAHLSKVMQRLVKAGFVNSTRGPKGGFMLSMDPEDITLREIYEVIDGPLKTNGCLFEAQVCLSQRCIFGTIFENLDETVIKYLTVTKLSDIIHSNKKSENCN
ncbi:MAG: Rrf2 family transcriptional regulator [Candidatus Latescibacteria bacterium]|jgi:Rrf2 family transcriptional regulator, nitric oxide-sensitive transcriptional repressor|nr:Rrf2 family transcriptional regulator [Candidatus Latescibacterota bacterium]